MTPAELFACLHERQVLLWAEGDRLRYKAPKDALTPELRAELVAHKEELLALLHAAQRSEEVAPVIPIAPRSADLPLSFAQQRLWFLDRLTPNSPLYNLFLGVQLTGALDRRLLARSLHAIIQRHEILRTTFALHDDQPIQRIAAPPRVIAPIPLLDIQHCVAPDSDTLIRCLATAEARRPFDLANGPLIRTTLLRRAPAEHVLLLTMHHSIADGWSFGLLIRELAVCYSAFSAGQPVALPALPIQYADFTLWQRDRLQGTLLETQRAYWQRQLADLPTLALPTDFPHPPVQSGVGAHQLLHIAPEQLANLHALSKRAGVTLFMTLLAALQLLLARLSDQPDLAIGSPIAGRTQRETEELIGCFINTLVLRTNLTGARTVGELLERVRAVCLGAYAHQDLPFEQLVAELHPTRDTSRHPLFQVLLVLQNTPTPTLELNELRLAPLDLESGMSKFDLSLTLSETMDGLSGQWEYRTDLFTAATITRLGRQLQTLLAALDGDLAQPLAQLSLLTPAERQQVLVEWNDTRSGDRDQGSGVRSRNADTCLHELVEAQVARSPDAVAVVFDDRCLTYAELNRRANQLARYLIQRDVGPDVLVGLCLERSLEMLVAILGVLKAGGAYLPLDPAYPPARLTFMLHDADVRVLVTKDEGPRRNDQSGLPVSLSACLLVCLETDWHHIAAESPSNPPARSTPDHLAYVIYTSGSTGRAKGAMVLQRGLLNLCYGLRSFFDDVAVCHTGLITSISFDISVNQIFPTLLFGRTLHIIPDSVKYSSPALLRYLTARHIHLLDSVPSYLQSVLADLAPGQVANALRYLLVGGERLEQALLQATFDQLGTQVAIVNIYGLTETTDINAFRVIRSEDLGQPIGVGWPLQNNQIYIVERWSGQLQPIGAPGEVCIAGTSLSRGYLNRPDLTAERFVPNPFGNCRLQIADCRLQSAICNLQSAIGTRLYKTGDIGRRRPDGVIEILGRLDHQVKIRGYRIEVGEIEAVLLRHSALRACAVVVREDTPGDRRLVAYVVQGSGSEDKETSRQGDKENPNVILSAPRPPTPDSRPLIPDLRAFLKERLPDYMIPSAFVALEELPKTPSGKLDRKALPAPDSGRAEADTNFVAPRTSTEEILAGIWGAVLGIERVGIADNLFELGGHSLLATQIVSRVRQIFQVEVPLLALFETPTVAGLAERIATVQHSTTELPTPPVQAQPRGTVVPLSFAQQRLWFLAQLDPTSPAYHLPYALQLNGALDVLALGRTLTALVARHESLRTTFALHNGQPAQQIAAPAALPLPLLDLTALADASQAPLTQALTQATGRAPFDLARGPLLRVVLLRLADDAHMLLLTMHHIISDGWSQGVLVRELVALYAAFHAGRAPALPPLPIQYADYALWQQQWLAGAVLDQQLAYWTHQLAEAPTVLDLPIDHPRPLVRSLAGASQPVELDAALTLALHALSRQAGTTLFMTLLAAFAALLARYSGQADIVVGTPIANRTQAATEGLIGCFVNTLVLRTRLRGVRSFAVLLAQVRAVCLAAYAHQELPFEQLVEALEVPRTLNTSPLFQVMLALQNAPQSVLAISELTLQPLVTSSGSAKFDLTLTLSEVGPALIGGIEYSTELFEAATIARLGRHLQTLLASIVAGPERPLADLPLLTATERNQLLREWNDTTVGVRGQGSGVSRIASACLHTLIAAQTARTPDAIAVVIDLRDKETGRQADKQLTRDQGSGIRDQDSRVPAPDPRPPTPDPWCVTYRELNARANQLAHHLRAMGVGPEVVVGVCLERSAAQVLASLGVLIAGGTYLPLDPTYPTERLVFMLADAQAQVLITDRGDKETRRQGDKEIAQLPVSLSPDLLVSRAVVDLSADWPVIALFSDTPANTSVGPDHLAYLIYTSGSTGTPKGVAVPHRAICNHLRWRQATYPLDHADRFLHKASSGFDIAVWEVFGTLAAGAQLVLAQPGGQQDAAYLARLIAEQSITVAHFGPAMLQVVLEQPAVQGWRALRQVFCGGEALTVGLQTRFFARVGAALCHQYGPTEATVDAIAWACDHDDADHAIPIGRPIANTQTYLLDTQLAPVPIGVAGELYIGGMQLARGYLNRPDLTAERFVPNPFTDFGFWILDFGLNPIQNPKSKIQNGDRLYKTGDLARYRPDGAIEFLGRIDGQIKLRGYRIELGEIEAVLLRHSALQACAVVLREDTPGQQRLVAYVVPTSDDRRGTIYRAQNMDDATTDGATTGHPTGTIYRAPTTGDTTDPPFRVPSGRRPSSFVQELRNHLKERLPDYMLPSALVALEALPLTPSGKLDRRKLPAPNHSGARPTSAEPRTPTEELLAGIWADVLRRDRVGVHENFFELGGHSLLATQVIARMRQLFAVELPLRALFEQPTVSSLAGLVLQAQQMADPLRSPPVQAQPRGPIVPLSFAQQRLWFLAQLDPTSPAYHLPYALQLNGALDLVALGLTLTALVARHESLRTTFALHDGQPVQQIAPPAPGALTLLDLRALPSGRHEPTARALTQQEAERPFDLARGPLLRIALLRLADDAHMLLLTMHHIISDGWSQGVLVRELVALYAAFHAGRAPELPPLPIQYADYALWQQQWLAGALLNQQLAYWTQQLAGVPAVLDLPTDHPRPAVQTANGTQQAFGVSPALSVALQTFNRQEGVTLFMTMLATFQTLLARYSGQEDIVVGSPIAGRAQQETEGLIGFFVNTLVLRARVSGTLSVRQLLGQVREVCLQAYAHQDLPFARLVEALHLPRDLSRSPLFQAMLVVQNAPASALELPGLTLQSLPLTTKTAKFDLTVSLSEGADGLAGVWEYNTDLFDATTITRMIGHFEVLLAGMLREPERQVGELALLTAVEQAQLANWNATEAVYPQHLGIHELFAAQVSRSPDAVALVIDLQDKETGRQGDKQRPGRTTNDGSAFSLQPPRGYPAFSLHVTYRELNARANQLAHHLRALGVGPEVRVGICMERSAALVIGLMGVLKAGGAYVPLDPAYPSERLAFMLDDSQAALLLTMTKDDGRWTMDDGSIPSHTIVNGLWSIVDLVADWPVIACQPGDPVAASATAANLAYVIYTSGSTGRPKGVMITHQGLVNYLHWCTEIYAVAAGRGAPLHSPIGFDLTITSLFAPLLAGQPVTLLPESPGAAALSATLDGAGDFSLVKLTPTHLALLEQAPSAALAGGWARALIIGGEALLADHVAFWRTHAPNTRIINEYGPTETVVGCCVYELPAASAISGAVPIGRPIANTQIYLLDAHMQVVPIGVAGELFIGGAGLARGYLGRPDLTAERFVPNPFAGDTETRIQGDTETRRHGDKEIRRHGDTETEDTIASSAFILPPSSFRLYKTGDLARYQPDGNLEFIGRIDQQVKLHGFRIELGEIEATLGQHLDVRACVVVARADGSGELRLVAYVVPTNDERRTTNDESESIVHRPSSIVTDMLAFLKARLPDYMLPAAFVVLDALPLTVNGKVDQRALPEPDGAQRALEQVYVAPQTPLEQELAAIWAELLQVEQVGRHDNFFALGGHSLLAVRLLAQIERAFGRRLPLAALFQDPTITQLAQRLSQQDERVPWSPIVALQPEGTRRPFFCVHPVSGSVLCYLELARALGPDQPFYGLQAAGLEGDQPPHTQIGEMAATYVAALRAVQPQGPYQLGGWSIGGVIAFEMAQQLHAQGQAIALLALLDTVTPTLSRQRAPVEAQDAYPLAGFVQDLAAQAGQSLDLSIDDLAQRTPDEQMRVVLAQAQALGVLPPNIGIAQVEDRLAVFKANLAAVGRYVPAPAPCRIILFRASDAPASRAADPLRGWGTIAAGMLEVIPVAGDHYTMVAPPHVQALAEGLRAYLT